MIEYTTEENKLIPFNQRRKVEKKVLPEYYKGIRTHKKMFELRKDEDGIKPGDILVLREWDGEKYTGGMTRREVTAVLKDVPEYGLMEGYCILSLQTPGWDHFKPSVWNDAVGRAEIEIENLPQAQQWIPCSERLPEEGGVYRITWVAPLRGAKRFVADAEYEVTNVWDDERNTFEGEWVFDEYLGALPGIKVVAWRQIDEPYRGQE